MQASASKVMRSAVISALLIPERLRNGVVYNPLAPAMINDPYPVYARLRETIPAYRSRLLRAMVFSRYHDVDTILRDHRRFSNDPRNGQLRPKQRQTLPDPEDLSILFRDPTDHTRLRSLVNKAFIPRTVNALEPFIRRSLHDMLDQIDDLSNFDLIETIAYPLPVVVIAEMLGVPGEDRARFKVWSNQRARLIEPTITAGERAEAERAGTALDDYFRPIIEQRRSEPLDDIVSVLAVAEDSGDRLTERELLAMLRLLLVAGNETTTNLIGNGVLALLRNPEQVQRLRQDPDLLPGAIEELLRYDSPVQIDFRYVRENTEVSGCQLQRGESVIVLLGAANRDPDVFDEPDRLDVGRKQGTHLSFGRGVHHCIGAPLARLEGRIVLETMLERFSDLELLAQRPRFNDHIVLRGLRSLPLRAVPA